MFSKKKETTRSESVRLRRDKQPTRRKPIPVQRSAAAQVEPSLPPVMVRNGSFGTPMAARQQKPRRRLDLPLNLPGVELRLPSMPVIHLGWRSISGVLSLILAGLFLFLWTSPTYQVKRLSIDGLQRLNAEEILNTLQLNGQSIFTLSPHQMAQDLQDIFPELTDVSIEINLPAEVYIAVTERQPVLAWKQQDQTIWVDADGVSFAARGEDPSLVTINANAAPTLLENVDVLNGQFMSKEVVESILKLASLAPANTSIIYDKQNGLGWQDQLGTQVHFGTSMEEMDVKMNIYKAIITYTTQNGLQPVLISVAYPHAPYFRLEQ